MEGDHAKKNQKKSVKDERTVVNISDVLPPTGI